MEQPKLIKISNHIDERGEVYGITQYIDEAFKDTIVDTRDLYRRIYTVENFQAGQIRAWHGHSVSSTIIHVIKGAAKILTYPFEGDILSTIEAKKKRIETFTLSEYSPGLVYVPSGYYNGHVSLMPGTIYLVMSSATIEQVKKDDVRMPWDSLGTECWEISRK